MAPLPALFFCARPDGTLTPLLPLDEFPAGLTVKDLPRKISAGDTQGMTSCGMANPREEALEVGGVAHIYHDLQENQSIEALHRALVLILNDQGATARIRSIASAALSGNTDRSAGQSGASNAPLPNVTAANTGLHPSAAVVPMTAGHQVHPTTGRANKKEFCSFWIRHGECDYSQQGCMFRHEMPLDPAGVAKLGLRDIPRWYREKYGVPSIVSEVLALDRSTDASRRPGPIAPIPANTPVRALEHNVVAVKAEAEPGNGRGTSAGPTKLYQTPPRGPAGYNPHAGSFNASRGGRSGSGSGRGSGGWKGRAPRSRFVNSPRPQVPREWAGEQGSERGRPTEPFPVMQGVLQSGSYGVAAGFNPVFGAGVGSLSGDNKVADDFSTEASRGSTLQFSQTPNRSSEASVKIPAPLGEPFTPMSFKRGARKASGFSSSESDDETRRTNVQSVSDLVSHEDVVLGVNETRAKWGPMLQDGVWGVPPRH